MHTRNQKESNGCKPSVIIQKIKDIIRGKDILQNSKLHLNRTDLKIQHNRKLTLLTLKKIIFRRILLTVISKFLNTSEAKSFLVEKDAQVVTELSEGDI